MRTKKQPKISASELVLNYLEIIIRQGDDPQTILQHFGIRLSRLKHQRSKKGTNGLIVYYTHISTNIALLWAMQNDRLILANFHIWDDYMKTVNNDTFMLIARFLQHAQETLDKSQKLLCSECGK